ncbi:MAG TPA: hypothetical protein VML55_11275 [Planctomycetaceae bacterium]|nr:hypothetical protein [Planctomycetaceae bacterium]
MSRPTGRRRCCPAAALLAGAAMAVGSAWPGPAGADGRTGRLNLAEVGDGQPRRGDSSADTPGEKADRQRKAVAMVYVVIGIAISGVALIVLILLGGHRVRSRARTRAPRAPDLDPLWYLKPGEHGDPAAGDKPDPR